MSKIETLKALPTPADVRQNVQALGLMLAQTNDRLDQTVQSLEQLPQLVAGQLTEQVIEVQKQFEELRQTLLSWTQWFSDIHSTHRQQVLDMAVLLEPIAPALAQIDQKQQQQEEILAKQDERLAKIEVSMSRLMLALPSLLPSKDGRVQVQPRLASKDDLAGVPQKVWEAKPQMFQMFGKS